MHIFPSFRLIEMLYEHIAKCGTLSCICHLMLGSPERPLHEADSMASSTDPRFQPIELERREMPFLFLPFSGVLPLYLAERNMQIGKSSNAASAFRVPQIPPTAPTAPNCPHSAQRLCVRWLSIGCCCKCFELGSRFPLCPYHTDSRSELELRQENFAKKKKEKRKSSKCSISTGKMLT